MHDDYPELLSLAVHELRTPVSVVSGYLRMLLRGGDPLTAQQRKMIQEAEKSSARLAELVAELSDVSKLDRDMAELTVAQFDVFSMLAELASSVHESSDREVRLEVRGEGAGARVSGDLPRIQTAFTAFLRAILREQPSAATVVADRRRVRSGDALSGVVVIAPAASVDEAYDAAPAAFVEKRGGLGLALPIARRVIERYGGRVWSPTIGGRPSSNAILISLPLQERDL